MNGHLHTYRKCLTYHPLGDIICVILGTESPMVLRPDGKSYQVVGQCFVTSLSDATAILGPLPKPWQVVCTNYIGKGMHRFCYFNTSTAEYSFEDPRFEERLDDWESVPARHRCLSTTTFKNRITGRVINSDPRFELENLKTRGVELRSFALT